MATRGQIPVGTCGGPALPGTAGRCVGKLARPPRARNWTNIVATGAILMKGRLWITSQTIMFSICFKITPRQCGEGVDEIPPKYSNRYSPQPPLFRQTPRTHTSNRIAPQRYSPTCRPLDGRPEHNPSGQSLTHVGQPRPNLYTESGQLW